MSIPFLPRLRPGSRRRAPILTAGLSLLAVGLAGCGQLCAGAGAATSQDQVCGAKALRHVV